jgi:hypothetical protein
VAVVNDDFTGTDDTELDDHNPAWTLSATGSFTFATIQNNALEIAAFNRVDAYRNDSAEQQSTIELAVTGSTARRTGPSINMTASSRGQYFWLANNNGTNYTTFEIFDGATNVAVLAIAGTVPFDEVATLHIIETANDGTDVTAEIYINGVLERTQVFTAASTVAGNDGFTANRTGNATAVVIDNFSSGSSATNDFASTLAPATLAATGNTTNTGTVASTLGPATLAAVGETANTGTLTTTLSPATLSAAGNTANSGNVLTTLGPATLAATGISTNYGNLAVTLAPATLAALGDVVNTGTLAVTLAPATLVATGNMKGLGTFSTVLAPATLVASNSANNYGYDEHAILTNTVSRLIIREMR